MTICWSFHRLQQGHGNFMHWAFKLVSDRGQFDAKLDFGTKYLT